MAKKVAKRRRTKKHGGGYQLPKQSFNPDALFTMVLSCETFISSNLKKVGVKVNKEALLEKVTSAVIDSVYPSKTDELVYNIAADALAAAYITFRKGDKRASRALAKLAFESPDCENLLAALVSVNEKAVGSKLVADDMGDDEESEPTDSTNVNTSDITDDADENEAENDTGGADSVDSDESNVSASYSRVVKNLKKKIAKAASDDYAIKYGIDTEQGDATNDDLDLDEVDPSEADELLEVETLGEINNVPDTMRLGRPADINDIVGEYPDNLPKINMLSSEQIAKIAKENPDYITIANKIAILGDTKGERIADKFLRGALKKAS